MKLFNFHQRKPVAFDGNGILLCDHQIRFSLSDAEKQIGELYAWKLMPDALSIRDLASFDFVLFSDQITKDKNYVAFEAPLSDHKLCIAMYDTDGHFLCARVKLQGPTYMLNTRYQTFSWVDFQWTLDNQGNRLIKIEHLTRHAKLNILCPTKKEFISIVDQSIVRRTLLFDGYIIKKIETDVYMGNNVWVPTSDKDFQALHWRKVREHVV